MITRISEAVLLHINEDDEDYRMYLHPGFTTEDVELALMELTRNGLMPIDEEEQEPELQPDRSILVWLTTLEPE